MLSLLLFTQSLIEAHGMVSPHLTQSRSFLSDSGLYLVDHINHHKTPLQVKSQVTGVETSETQAQWHLPPPPTKESSTQ